MKLVVIDDEPLVLKSLVIALNALGHKCEGFDAWDSAKEALLQSTTDVLITDLNIPKTDGYTILEETRKLDLPKQPRMIAITGDTNARKNDANQSLDFDAYLSKPYSLKQLAAAITLDGHSGD